MVRQSPFFLTRVSLPYFWAYYDPVEREYCAEEKRKSERAQDVPIKHVHANKLKDLNGAGILKLFHNVFTPITAG
jgi:hypothetical protein